MRIMLYPKIKMKDKRKLPELNSIIRRDCYWYGWGSHPSVDYCYPSAYGAMCFHPKVDEFFSDNNSFEGGKEIHRITPNCSKCSYIRSMEEAEASEAFIPC